MRKILLTPEQNIWEKTLTTPQCPTYKLEERAGRGNSHLQNGFSCFLLPCCERKLQSSLAGEGPELRAPPGKKEAISRKGWERGCWGVVVPHSSRCPWVRERFRVGNIGCNLQRVLLLCCVIRMEVQCSSTWTLSALNTRIALKLLLGSVVFLYVLSES